MEKKYLKYSTEELAQDLRFIRWVNSGENESRWRQFVNEYPSFELKVKTAKKLVQLLDDSHQELEKQEVNHIWEKIRESELNQQQGKRIQHTRLLKYAAVLVFFLALGGSVSFFFLYDSSAYYFAGSEIDMHSSKSKLILSNGNEVDLDRDHSTIALKDESIKINNDSIINLKQSQLELVEEKLNEVVVPYGKRTELVLDDGTKVWLNAGSRFAFPAKFAGDSRTVYLEGEAYFEVAHNPQKAFLVNVNKLQVRVLGTRFNVSAYDSDETIETVLIEGKVAIKEKSKLAAFKKDIYLEPNQKAIFNKDKRNSVVWEDSKVENAIGWVNGWFSFSQDNLFHVFKRLERYYNVQFRYDESFMSNELLTGKLDMSESLDEVLSYITNMSAVEFRTEKDIIYVTKKYNKIPLINK